MNKVDTFMLMKSSVVDTDKAFLTNLLIKKKAEKIRLHSRLE